MESEAENVFTNLNVKLVMNNVNDAKYFSHVIMSSEWEQNTLRDSQRN